MLRHHPRYLLACVAFAVVVASLAGMADAQYKARRRSPPKLAAKSDRPPVVARPDASKRDDLNQRLTKEEMRTAMLHKCIQPNYRAWEQVSVGMSVARVRELLGEPLEEALPPRTLRDDVTYIGRLTYGLIEFDSSSMPDRFSFDLLTLDGKIYLKQDPFLAPVTKTAKPSTPVLMTPSDGVSFQHYPRFLDLRWYPSSGEYPISYTIEVQHGYPDYKRNPQTNKLERAIDYGPESPSIFSGESKIPYLAWPFVGSGPGRWRVKAKNRHGESEWTGWRTFDFTLKESIEAGTSLGRQISSDSIRTSQRRLVAALPADGHSR